MATFTDKVNQIYDKNLEFQKSQLQKDFQAADENYTQQEAMVNQAAEDAKIRTAMEAARTGEGLYAKELNLTGGAMAQRRFSQDNQLQANVSSIQEKQQMITEEISRQRALLSQKYESDIRKAQADNDMGRAQMLYAAAKEEESRLKAQEEAAAAIAAKEMKTELEIQKEAAQFMIDEKDDYTRYGLLNGLTQDEINQLNGVTPEQLEQKRIEENQRRIEELQAGNTDRTALFIKNTQDENAFSGNAVLNNQHGNYKKYVAHCIASADLTDDERKYLIAKYDITLRDGWKSLGQYVDDMTVTAADVESYAPQLMGVAEHAVSFFPADGAAEYKDPKAGEVVVAEIDALLAYSGKVEEYLMFNRTSIEGFSELYQQHIDNADNLSDLKDSVQGFVDLYKACEPTAEQKAAGYTREQIFAVTYACPTKYKDYTEDELVNKIYQLENIIIPYATNDATDLKIELQWLKDRIQDSEDPKVFTERSKHLEERISTLEKLIADISAHNKRIKGTENTLKNYEEGLTTDFVPKDIPYEEDTEEYWEEYRRQEYEWIQDLKEDHKKHLTGHKDYQYESDESAQKELAGLRKERISLYSLYTECRVEMESDFEEKSKYVPQEGANDEYVTEYEAVNGEQIDPTRHVPKGSGLDDLATIIIGFNQLGKKELIFVSEKERKVYNYLYATEGKEAASTYLNSVRERINTRYAEDRFKSYKGSTGKELLFALEAGTDKFVSGIKNAFNTTDDYIPVSSTQILSSKIRNDLADDGFKLPDWLGGASIAQFGYDMIDTVANMAPSIIVSAAVSYVNPVLGSALGAALMGTSAAGNAYQEKLNLGYTKSQARAYSTMVGASEALLQYFIGGISKLGTKGLTKTVLKSLDKVDNIFAKFAKSTGGKLLLSATSEAIEEGLQTILEPYFWQIASGEEMDVNWSEVLYSSLMGFVSGGIMEGGTTAIKSSVNHAKMNKADTIIGKDIIKKEDAVSGLLTESVALKEKVDPKLKKELTSEILKVTKGLDNKYDSKSTAKHVGRLYRLYTQAQAQVKRNAKSQGGGGQVAASPAAPRNDTGVSNNAYEDTLALAKNANADTLTFAMAMYEQSGTVSNAQAERILNDPQALQMLIELMQAIDPNFALPVTKSEQRKAIKSAIAILAKQQAATAAQTADSGTDASLSVAPQPGADIFQEVSAMAKGENVAQPQSNMADDVIAMTNGTYQRNNATEVDIENNIDYDNENKIYDALDGVPKRAAGIKYNNGNSIQLSKKEYSEVTSRISTNYHNANTSHDGIQFVDRSTDGKNAKMYMYLYRDHGFGNYEIIARLDYSRQGEVIAQLREVIRNERMAEGVRDFVSEARDFDERFNIRSTSDYNQRSNFDNEQETYIRRGKRGNDDGRTGGSDSYGYDGGGVGLTPGDSTNAAIAATDVSAGAEADASLSAAPQPGADIFQEVSAMANGTYQPKNTVEIDTAVQSDYDNTINEAEGGVISNGRREESRESFYRRANEEVRTVRERGKIACGYYPVTDKTGRAGQTEKALQELGIPVIVHEGLEANIDGTTSTIQGAASSVAGDVVYVRNTMKTDPIETAGHEAYHFWKHMRARSMYTDTIVDNIDFSSDEFVQFQKDIAKVYFGEEVGIEDDGADKLAEEIFAYITGLVHAGDPSGEVHKFLRDYDAVKAAWDLLVEKQTKGQSPTQTDVNPGDSTNAAIAATDVSAGAEADASLSAAPQPGADIFQEVSAMARGDNVAQKKQQNIDNASNIAYNNIINGGEQNERAASAGADQGGVSGVYEGRRDDDGRRTESNGASINSGLILLNPSSINLLNQRGVVYVELYECSADNAAFSVALDNARNADKINGWAVTFKTNEELDSNNIRTFMDGNASTGFAIAPDGDIEAVFANKAAGAPKGSTKVTIPLAIANGGTKLDCYGIGLVRLYAKYGFIPVARTTFDPTQANDGWTPDKGTPDIYFLMHNGDNADVVVQNYGNYHIPTPQELDALPLMEYEAAYDYRDALLAQREKNNVNPGDSTNAAIAATDVSAGAEADASLSAAPQPGADIFQEVSAMARGEDVGGKKTVETSDEQMTENKEHISLEDYANNESPIWQNVDYNDEATKNEITQKVHNEMVSSGKIVTVSDDVVADVEKSFPDLRSMKKKDRLPILKEAIQKLKSNIRQFLSRLTGQSFEFEVNGHILDAKLYSTGINEVLEKVTKEKANMLYSTEEIFRNAQYLYSTQDYDGDPNVYRWNYFYTPVQINGEIVGVRIAVRDMVRGSDGQTGESQIYNWGIKKDAPLDGGSHGPKVASSGVSSDASTNSIPNTTVNVNPGDSTNAANVSTDASAGAEADASLSDAPQPGADIFQEVSAMAKGKNVTQSQDNVADDIIAMANGTYQPKNAAEVDTTAQTNYDNENNQGGIADGTGQTTQADDLSRTAADSLTVRTETRKTNADRSGVQSDVGEARGRFKKIVPYRKDNGLNSTITSFDDDIITPKAGSPLAEVQNRFLADYGIKCYIISDSAWERNNPALAYDGDVYIRESINAETLTTAVPHESTHIMAQLDFAPYTEFLSRTSDLIQYSTQAGQDLLILAANHRSIDLFSMSDAQVYTLYGEANAIVYGMYKGGILENSEYGYEWISGAFYDFDGYIKELDAIHEQFKQQRKSDRSMPVADSTDANPSVGAADQNFTGRAAYQNLLSDENSQRDRPGDVRPMEVPKYDDQGGKVSEFVGNAYGAEVTPDHFIPRIEKMVEEHKVSYDPKTNRESFQEAADVIKKRGAYAARVAITNSISKGKIGNTDIAAAMLLFDQYVHNKSQESQDAAAELFVDMQQMATQTGRDLQLFKMLRKMTPQGQLMAVTKNVDRFVNNLNKRRSKSNQAEVTIPQELTNEYLDAAEAVIKEDTQENQDRKAEAEAAIYAYAASNIKATMKEKWDAWRYLAMLGNPKTHIRNMIGNATFRPFVASKRYLSAAMQAVFLKPEQRTVKILGFSQEDVALRKWARQDAKTDNVKKMMGYTARTGDASVSEIGDQRTIYNTKILEKARTGVQDLMSAEDMLAKRGVYATYLASFLKAKGITVEQLSLTSKPDIKIVYVDQNTSGKSYADLKNEVLRKANDNHWFESPHTNKDTGMPIFVNQRSFAHAFSNLRHDFGTDTILAMGHIPELIESSVLTKIDPPKNPAKAETRVFTFFGAISGENGVEPVKLTVKEYSSKNKNEMPQNILNFFRKNKATETYNSLYDVKALEVIGIEHVKKEFGASASVAGDITQPVAKGTPNSTIKIAELLNLVKGNAVKYIPKNLVDPNILNEARDYAVKEAMKATFNDRNALSDFLANKLRYKGNNIAGKVLDAAAEGVLPFRRTPANIAVRAFEYSPAAFLKSITDIRKLRSGEMTAAAYIDNIASALTGTAALGLGYALAAGILGIRLVGSKEDKDDKRTGHKSYALEIGDWSIPIDWAAPSALPLFMGANLYDSFNPEDEEYSTSGFTAFLDATVNTFEPMLELSCLSSLNDLITDARYAEEGRELYAIAASAATSYLMQALPTVGGQIEQAFEGEKNSVYAESSDPFVRELQEVIGRATQKIPGVDLYQAEKVDAWGRTADEKNAVQSVFDAFINPSNYSEIRETDADREIERLNGIVEKSVSPSTPPKKVEWSETEGEQSTKHTYNLTSEEHVTLAKMQGQTQKKLVDDLISNEDYDFLSDEDKAEAIRYAYDYAKDFARGEVIEEHPGITTKWMAEIDGDVAEAIIRHVATGTTKKYLDLSVQDAAYVVDIFNMIQPETGRDKPRTIQKIEAVAGADEKLNEQEQRTALKDVLDEDAYEKFQNILALGYDVDDYAASYRIYLDEKDKGGKGTKDRIIRNFRQEFGISKSAATKLYECYVPPKD